MGFSFENKKNITIANTFLKKTLDESNCKPNKIDKGSKFNNRSMISWYKIMIQKYIQCIMKKKLLLLKDLLKS